jgi:AcrR family transcriptional regulator
MKASMRRIAQSAGVTSGNIYRYYASKEQLFDAIVQPVYEQYAEYMSVIREDVGFGCLNESPDAPGYFNKIESTIVKLFKTYSGQLMILLSHSGGSKYESAKSELVELTYFILEKVISKTNHDEAALTVKENALAKMLASSIVEGLCLILRDNEEGDILQNLVDQFLFVYSEGITSLLKKT